VRDYYAKGNYSEMSIGEMSKERLRTAKGTTPLCCGNPFPIVLLNCAL
jgi:hypothetical protein